MALQGSFSIARVNPTSILDINTIRDEQFRAWAQFLNEHSIIRYALVTPVPLNYDALRELYCSAVNTSGHDGLAITYRLFGRSIKVTERDVNRILHFPTENLVADPTPDQIERFFRLIKYQDGNLNTGNLSRTYLTQYWNFFFNILNHVFTSDRTNLDRISEFIQTIGYAVANNLRINFGKIVLGQIILKMKQLGTRDAQIRRVDCLYPRFLQLILNDFLSDADRLRLDHSRDVECSFMKTNVINYISNKSYTDVPTILTEYLKTVPLPLLPRSVRAAPHMEFATSSDLPHAKRCKPSEPETVEGNLGLVPFNPFKFNLPGRKSLDLFPDLPLVTSGRHLASREVGSSRTFIAPSDKGPRMISFADTHLGGSFGQELRGTRAGHESRQHTPPHAPITRTGYNRLLARVQTLENELPHIRESIAEIKILQLNQNDVFQAQLSSMAAQFSHAINSLVKTVSSKFPTPRPTILEDNPNEGEKVDEQEANRRNKGKEKVGDTDLNLFLGRKS